MGKQNLNLESLMSTMTQQEKLLVIGLLMAISDEDYDRLMEYPEEELAEILVAFSKEQEERLPEFLRKYLSFEEEEE